jgi:hypothetical protein
MRSMTTYPKESNLSHRIALLVVLATALASTGAAGATTTAQITIATASATGFRVDVLAQRTGAGEAPTATVTLVTYRQTDRTFKLLSRARLRGTFFWKTITGPRAVCTLNLATAGTAHVTVQLLTSPAIGCGSTTTIKLPTR